MIPATTPDVGVRDAHPCNVRKDGAPSVVVAFRKSKGGPPADIHNGLVGWNVTEVTFQIIRIGDDQQHYYRQRISIAPLQTEHVDIKLGMQLPADDYIKYRGKPGGQNFSHWSWLIVGAKGRVAK